ncbi:type 2 periplasmic-binding domain-containing protein [Micromonospora rubida]|uniref:hypothetical protein n=1 Tax=Micromonospora rubida TaxID=2697657 RepID=UPI001376AD15|nr:hypothetical protein [Micromonospora rubida]NBE84966.1 hypothetical protein [Micromonospora rubida]
MRAGTLDAMFFSGGLPTPGITDLLAAAPGRFRFLPIADLIEPLTAVYGPVYTTTDLPKEADGTPGAVPPVAWAGGMGRAAARCGCLRGEPRRTACDRPARRLTGSSPRTRPGSR